MDIKANQNDTPQGIFNVNWPAKTIIDDQKEDIELNISQDQQEECCSDEDPITPINDPYLSNGEDQFPGNETQENIRTKSKPLEKDLFLDIEGKVLNADVSQNNHENSVSMINEYSLAEMDIDFPTVMANVKLIREQQI